ncbi:hypothetical protein O7A70_30810 [Mesorhizobium sp. Cs1299R1N1]|uniref:hypothetical protein n=1 Tax=Mesorhizobium sp. Cs1299R1N1 TaxID=3015172 RepID=UPI00301E0DF7
MAFSVETSTSPPFNLRHAQRLPPTKLRVFTYEEERRQTLDEAERTCQSVAGVCAELGYELVTLPLAPVEERVRFLLDAAGLSLASRA